MASFSFFALGLIGILFGQYTRVINADNSIDRRYGRSEVILPIYDDDGADNSTNLFRNAKDMIVLSQYIYGHAAMVEGAQEVKRLFGKDKPKNVQLLESISASNDKSVDDFLRIFDENDKVIKDSDRKVREAAKVISDDLDEGHATHALKDSIVLSIHAEPEDIKQSCVYAVTVNHNLKRVSVIFRGTSNMGDWIKDAIVFMKRVDNPVKKLVSSSPSRIGIHGGFAAVLLREEKMKDTLDEVKSYLKDLEGYRLFVTGHSLGGALATLFGFYAAADDGIINSIVGPVSLFSVSSPRVGNKYFGYAFKDLENQGRLRHARIHNAQDKVTKLPYIGGAYRHVGLEMRLRPMISNLPPVLDYPLTTQWEQNGHSLWNDIITLHDALRLHGCDLILGRLKLFRAEFEETTLEKEYKTVWGFESS